MSQPFVAHDCNEGSPARVERPPLNLTQKVGWCEVCHHRSQPLPWHHLACAARSVLSPLIWSNMQNKHARRMIVLVGVAPWWFLGCSLSMSWGLTARMLDLHLRFSGLASCRAARPHDLNGPDDPLSPVSCPVFHREEGFAMIPIYPDASI